MNGNKLKKPIAANQYDEEYYLESCGGSEFFKRYGPKVLKPALAYSLSKAEIKPGMRILDIGCGRGELLYHIKQMGAVGIGTDYAGAAIKIAQEVSGCEVVQCDVKSLPFGRNHFDRVFLMGVVDHLHLWELEACFKEIERVLKPEGRVLIHTCANRLYYKNWSYDGRFKIAQVLRTLGMNVRDPSPPRSDEDKVLHVHEHDYFSLKSLFRKTGWTARIEPRPNYKLLLKKLYGEALPDDFPLTPASEWKIRFYMQCLWWPPLKWILAREFFCIALPPKNH